MSDAVRYSQLIKAARAGSQEAINNLLGSVHAYLLFVANQELDVQLRKKVGSKELLRVLFIRLHRPEDYRARTQLSQSVLYFVLGAAANC